MQIGENLPQYNQQKTLFVVLGTQEGKFYLASEGEINEVEHIKVPNQTYSDKEGHFEKRGHGNFYGSGSVEEEKDYNVEKKFSKTVSEKLQEYQNNKSFDVINLFVPSHLKKYIEEDWGVDLQKKVENHIDGNYVSENPIELIKKVEIVTEDETVAKGEAKDILDKTAARDSYPRLFTKDSPMGSHVLLRGQSFICSSLAEIKGCCSEIIG